jgi:hypothetical protein
MPAGTDIVTIGATVFAGTTVGLDTVALETVFVVTRFASVI